MDRGQSSLRPGRPQRSPGVAQGGRSQAPGAGTRLRSWEEATPDVTPSWRHPPTRDLRAQRGPLAASAPQMHLPRSPGSGEGAAQAWRPLPPPGLPARKRRSCSLPPSSPCASGSKCPLLERTPVTSDEGHHAAWSLLLPPAAKGSRIHGHRGPGLRHVTRGGHSSTLGSPRGDHSRPGARTACRAAGLSWGGRPRAPRAARARAQGAVMQGRGQRHAPPAEAARGRRCSQLPRR